MKFISWNVNGLRACVGKGFGEAVNALNPDFLCLQETKLQPGQIDLSMPGYESYWNYAEKRATPALPFLPRPSLFPFGTV